jgi:hypothetical protein
MLNAPAITDLDLTEIATEINTLQKRIMTSIVRMGELLTIAKAELRGGFVAWVEANLNFSIDSAENFMATYRAYLQAPEVLQLAPSVVYSLKAAPQNVVSAMVSSLNTMPAHTPVYTLVTTTRTVAQVSAQYTLDHPGVIDGLMRLPPDDLYAIKATGLIQPGDEADAVSLRDTPEKLLRALDQMQRTRVDVAREAVVKLDLYVRTVDNVGAVIAGFESQDQAENWLTRRMK